MIGYLGLTGPAGAGKDTVYERLRELDGERFVRLSVADPLKISVANLLNVSTDQLERWKRSGEVGIQIVHKHRGGLDSPMSMRTFLQRYGTESHRDVFGADFWLDEWERRAQQVHVVRSDAIVVNTSVRFVNEAQRILDLGGEIWEVAGPQDDGADGHASEAPLPRSLITRVIDNEYRARHQSGAPDYAYLDDQIETLLDMVTRR